jgi:nucleoside-diphosphate-sugar epimerase
VTLRVLLTGGSSFTGTHFAQALVAAGHEVTLTLQGGRANYTGLRAKRLATLEGRVRFVEDAPFGSDRFLALLAEKTWDRLCHHGADTTNYRTDAFDLHGALARNTHNARRVLEALAASATRSPQLVLTGSFWEPRDAGGRYEPAFTPYALSKALTADIFRYECDRVGVPLTRFVVPNPFGPLEEDRFTNYLVRCFAQGEPAEVRTPDYVRDNIPVDLLAKCYAGAVNNAATGPYCPVDPSGYVERQGDFAKRVARNLHERLGWACDVRESVQTQFSEPMIRINSTSAKRLVEWNEQLSWDSFAEWAQNPETYLAATHATHGKTSP